MSRACHIVGAGDFWSEGFHPQPGDFIIAADGGILRTPRCDLAVGDFDSLGYVPEGVRVIRHPVMKDDTDTMLAVKWALQNGFRRILLHGGSGGRSDHTMANLQTLSYIARHGGIGVLMAQPMCAACLLNGSAAFEPNQEGILSVFAWGGEARGVDIEGLLYTLKDGTLTPDMPLGVSNHFTGQSARVSVRDGMLLLMWPGPALPEFQ